MTNIQLREPVHIEMVREYAAIFRQWLDLPNGAREQAELVLRGGL